MIGAGLAGNGGALAGVDTAPITSAPRIFAIWHKRMPQPPAAECTRQLDAGPSGKVEVAR